jgi:hypothetical protein
LSNVDLLPLFARVFPSCADKANNKALAEILARLKGLFLNRKVDGKEKDVFQT